MKVVQKLVRAGYVESIRGAGGGLRLNQHPTRIGVGDVVRYMEPDLCLVECFRDEALCVMSPVCRLRGIFRHAIEKMLTELDAYTIGDLLHRSVRDDLIDILHIHDN